MGTDLQTSRRVIVETLHDTLLSDENAVNAVRNEIELSRKLQSDTFMSFIDSVNDNNRIFLIWKHVDASLLTNNPSLELLTDRDLCKFIARIVKALDSAHRKGIIHGALSTDSILVTPTLSPIIIGFPLPGASVETDPGTQGGVSAYAAAAPEIFRGEPIDETCDWYSIGVIARHLLRDAHEHQRMTALSNTHFASLYKRNEETQAAVTIIENLSSHDKDQRRSSAELICDASFVDSLATPIHGTPAIDIEKKVARRIKRQYKHRGNNREKMLSTLIFMGRVTAVLAGAGIILALLYLLFQPQ